MFWGWMISPGKKGLAEQHFTAYTGDFTTRPPEEPIQVLQGKKPDFGQDVTGRDFTLLLQRGFAVEEVQALCRLQEWYQNGGSDRASILYHLEFLRRLVANGLLER